MHPERGNAALHLSLPDDLPSTPPALRTAAAPALATPSSKAAWASEPTVPGRSCCAGKFHRQGIGIRLHDAGIEDLDRIHQRGNLQQVFQLPCPERISNGCETLIKAPCSRRRRMVSCGRESAWDLLGHKSGQDLAAGGLDLLADDDQLRVQCLRSQGAGDGVVIGDDHPVQAFTPRRRDEFLGRGSESLDTSVWQ